MAEPFDAVQSRMMRAVAMRELSADVDAVLERLDEFAHVHGWIDGEWFRVDLLAVPADGRNPLHLAACKLLPTLESFRKHLAIAAHRAETESLYERKGMTTTARLAAQAERDGQDAPSKLVEAENPPYVVTQKEPLNVCAVGTQEGNANG